MKSITIELDVEVPMRDGTVLRAAIYRPSDAEATAVFTVLQPG